MREQSLDVAAAGEHPRTKRDQIADAQLRVDVAEHDLAVALSRYRTAETAQLRVQALERLGLRRERDVGVAKARTIDRARAIAAANAELCAAKAALTAARAPRRRTRRCNEQLSTDRSTG